MTDSTFGPRNIKFSLLFFKSLAGFGIGIMGMFILLIFVLLGIGTGGGDVAGPFVNLTAILMGLVTALVTNSFAIYIFALLDPEKYPVIRPILRHVVSLNIFTFIFLLPVYLIASMYSLQAVFLINALHLALSAEASIFALELSSAQTPRQNLLAIYGVTFGMLLAVILNITVFAIVDALTITQATEVAAATSKGATFMLFSLLPITWFAFGFFTTLVEMVYHWIYVTWGVDYLSRES